MNNNLNGILFRKKLKAKDGHFRFNITEIYPRQGINGKDLCVSREKEISSDYVIFEPRSNGFYSLDINPIAFEQEELHASKNQCELFIYPVLEEDNYVK